MDYLSRRKLLLLASAAYFAGSSSVMAAYKRDEIMRVYCRRIGGKPTRRFFRFYCDGVDQRRWRRRFPPDQNEHFLDRREGRDPPEGGGPGGGNRSDRRLKRGLCVIGCLPGGLSLYRFKYLWSDVEFVGVMAQEVLAVIPEAVSVDAGGYYSVNYALIGLPMMTYAQWLACDRPYENQVLAVAA